MNAATQILERIPHRPPFLFVDDIVSETAEGIVARRTWRADEDFYKGHYPGAPITPGVLPVSYTHLAWQLAFAECAGATIVARDRKAFAHLGNRYERFDAA